MSRQPAIETLLTIIPAPLKRSVLRHKAKAQWGRIAAIAYEATGNHTLSDAIWSG